MTEMWLRSGIVYGHEEKKGQDIYTIKEGRRTAVHQNNLEILRITSSRQERSFGQVVLTG